MLRGQALTAVAGADQDGSAFHVDEALSFRQLLLRAGGSVAEDQLYWFSEDTASLVDVIDGKIWIQRDGTEYDPEKVPMLTPEAPPPLP